MNRRLVKIVGIVTAVLMLAGCASANVGGGTGSQPGDSSSQSSGRLSGQLTVYAAASLTASFNKLSVEFEKTNPDVTVNPITYDGSSTLALQINEGAPADVFASANQANMSMVSDAGMLEGDPSVFTTNMLQIAVQPGNPKNITGLADLANENLQVVLCAPEVPCGAASHQLFDLDDIIVTPVSEEQNVKAVITKVQAGEADAGLVYVTDISAANGKVDGVTISNADQALNRYPIAVLRDAPDKRIGKAFIAFVLSDAGQKTLTQYGFTKP